MSDRSQAGADGSEECPGVTGLSLHTQKKAAGKQAGLGLGFSGQWIAARQV